jgi:hypothetical protein
MADIKHVDEQPSITCILNGLGVVFENGLGVTTGVLGVGLPPAKRPFARWHCKPTLQAGQDVDKELYDELHNMCLAAQNRGGGH